MTTSTQGTLRVRVARGALPVEGARVRFTVEAGGGTVGSPAAGVADATCAIVLSASIQNEGEEAFMVDATTILTYITISQLNPEINLRVELGSSS